MKNLISFLTLVFLTISLNGQGLTRPVPKSSVLNPFSGYVNITEFGSGLGLSVTSVPYSKYYFGLTTVNGYQANENLLVGIGLGFHFYNKGYLLPLYASGRLTYPISGSRLSPYANLDGGLLINFGNSGNENRVFLNPVVGTRYTINPALAFDMGVGILAQKLHEKKRDTFLNLKMGIVFIPRKGN